MLPSRGPSTGAPLQNLSAISISMGVGGHHTSLAVLVPFRSGSHLCVLFLLQNIVPMLQNFSHFSRLLPPSDIPPPARSSPASRRLPAPITPRIKFAFSKNQVYVFKESSLRFKESSFISKESSLRFKESSFISKESR